MRPNAQHKQTQEGMCYKLKLEFWVNKVNRHSEEMCKMEIK